jgi:hypothetical protein
MKVLQRDIQQVRQGKWAEQEKLNEKFNAVERRLGFPPNKRRYRCYFGGHNLDTLIVEFEWDSLAEMEATYEKAMADPEWQALAAEFSSVIKSHRGELYAPLP